VKSRINRDELSWPASCNKWECGRHERTWNSEASAEHAMTWTCEQTEARLSDYLDAFFSPPSKPLSTCT